MGSLIGTNSGYEIARQVVLKTTIHHPISREDGYRWTHSTSTKVGIFCENIGSIMNMNTAYYFSRKILAPMNVVHR
jgi:hypothetical protein